MRGYQLIYTKTIRRNKELLSTHSRRINVLNPQEMIERYGPPAEHTQKFMSGGLWYQKIDIDGNKLTYTSYDRDGKVVDEFTINKEAPQE